MSLKTDYQTALDALEAVLEAVSDSSGRSVTVFQDPPSMIHQCPAAVLFHRWDIRRVNSNRLLHAYLKIQVNVAQIGGRITGKYDEIHKAARELGLDLVTALDQNIALGGTVSNSEYGDDTSGVTMLETAEFTWGEQKYLGFEIPYMLRFHQGYTFG